MLLDFLQAAGAKADPVLPYRYASDAESRLVDAAIRGMAAGEFDAIAFTSTPQIERLEDVAQQRGLETELRQGLARIRIAAVGPVAASALKKRGFAVAAMPATSFHSEAADQRFGRSAFIRSAAHVIANMKSLYVTALA